MYLNQFSVRVPEGNEISGGYVELRHGQNYTIQLKNDRHLPCDAILEIDGKSIGTFRLYAGSGIKLERPPHDTGQFTFYKIGTHEARQAQLDEGNPDLGLIKVQFIPQKHSPPITTYWGSVEDVPMASANITYRSATVMSNAKGGLSAGGTGLSGYSNQSFTDVGSIERDYSQSTTIYLRLVAKNGDEIRPLTQYSTPIPPRV